MNKQSKPIGPTGLAIRISTTVLLGMAAAGAKASDFYKLTIIAESSPTASADWRILGGFVGINDAGTVTWRADRFVGGVFEGGVFAGDGVTQTTVATGSVSVPSINNLGQVMYVDTSSMRLWNQGLASDFYVCNQQPNPLRCYSGGLSDNTRIPLVLLNARSFGIVGAGGQIVESGTTPDWNLAYTNSVISRNGRNTAIAGRNSANNVVIGAIDQTRPGQVGQFTLGPTSDWNIVGLSQNDLGNIALLSGSTTAMTGRLVGVVTARSAAPSLIRVADTSDGTFSDFGTPPPTMGVAINNLNEVAFYARGGTNNENNGVYVGDVSGRTPLPVVTFNEVFSTDGAKFQAVFQNGFSPQAINGKGQIAFFASIQRGTQNHNAILRADPLPGVSPSNPILPAPGAALPGGGWRITIPFTTVTPPRVGQGGSNRCASPATTQDRLACAVPAWIDPPIAIGYEYKVEAPGPNFASVRIPAPLANGDESFQVEFNGQVATLRAGEIFDFTTSAPGGVATFRITGIDTAEALDPNNPQAFVTGLTFVPDPTIDLNVTMTPIVADPNDTDLDGVPNAADLCPNTAAGAAADANGCATNQRDSDGDGVVDSLDQCPATPMGAPVDANGCSALQLDADGDGVPNTADACPGTAPGDAVNIQGCSAAQRDSDGDGVNDSLDQCPNTPPGTPVNTVGCASSQLDADGDGVPDSTDQCPNTAPGASVNATGCSTAQLDSDGDGVRDSVDQCPGTAPGTAVDANGCPLTTPAPRCDVNGDNFIDYRDIRAIILAIGKPATVTTDPRDANGNGKIELLDAAICTTKCSRLLCLPPR